MKRLKTIFAVAMSVVALMSFVSCEELMDKISDLEMDETFLEGTTWSYSETEDGETYTTTLKFNDNTVTLRGVSTDENAEPPYTQVGAYKYIPPMVTLILTDGDETFEEIGTVTSTTIKFDDATFTKQ